MAAGVAVLLLTIPVVHFVGGPLGPFLGALAMSMRTPCGGRGIVVLGAVLGLTESFAVGTGIAAMRALSSGSHALPEWAAWLLEPSSTAIVVGGAWAYATSLGVMGAAVGRALRPCPA